MSFSVSDADGRFEWASRPLGVFARPAHVVDPRFHRMLPDLVRFNREARGLIALNGDGPSLRALPGRRRLLGVLRRAADRAPGRVDLVRRPGPAVVVPGQLPGRVLRRTMASCSSAAGRAGARVAGGSRRYVEAIARRARAGACACATPVRRIERDRPGRRAAARRHRAPRFDEVVLALHSDQALALLAATHAPPSGRCSAPSPTSPTRPCCTPTSACCRAGAPRAGELELPPAGGAGRRTTVTYDMNRLQSLRADRRVLRHAEPHRGDRPATDHPPHRRTRIPVYTRAGVAAQARSGEISGWNRTHYCGAYWRWGFHEDGVSERAARGRRRSAARPRPPWRHEPLTLAPSTRGGSRHRRTEPVQHEFRYRLFLLLLDLDELPGCSTRPAVVGPAPGAGVVSPRRLPGRPGRPLDAAPRAAGRGAARAPPDRARSGCSPSLRYLGRGFNPVSFHYCLDAAGERVEAVVAEVTNTPWGERHAYVLDAAGSGPRGDVDKALHVSPFMGMDHRYDVARERAGRGPARPHRRAVEDGEPASSTPTLALRRRELTARLMARCSRTYPPLTLACWRRIYGQALAPAAQGRAAAPPTPERAAAMSRSRRAAVALRALLRRIALGAARASTRSRRRAHARASAPTGARAARDGRRALAAHLRPLVRDGSVGPRRGLRRRAVGLADLVGAAAARRARTAARSTACGAGSRPLRRAAAAAAPRGRRRNTRRRRPAQHRRPLRPRQRALRAVPRPRRMIYSCALSSTPRRHARGRAAREARARSAASSSSGRDDHLLEIGTGWGGSRDPRRGDATAAA